MNYLTKINEITNHRASTKVKMRQLLVVLEELYNDATTNHITTFDDIEKGNEVIEAIHKCYADLHYSFPTVEIVTAHETMIEKLRIQFTHSQEAFFFPYTAILQGYTINHDVTNMEKVKNHLLTLYKEQALAIYHAIFSGLKIKPKQELLNTYYQAVLSIEPNNEADAKHLEAIHEIFESLIWKKK